jgi:hypothetical protein
VDKLELGQVFLGEILFSPVSIIQSLLCFLVRLNTNKGKGVKPGKIQSNSLSDMRENKALNIGVVCSVLSKSNQHFFFLSLSSRGASDRIQGAGMADRNTLWSSCKLRLIFVQFY